MLGNQARDLLTHSRDTAAIIFNDEFERVPISVKEEAARAVEIFDKQTHAGQHLLAKQRVAPAQRDRDADPNRAGCTNTTGYDCCALQLDKRPAQLRPVGLK